MACCTCDDHQDDFEYGDDEGSAMIELAYDIAPGATYKFHTSKYGEDVSHFQIKNSDEEVDPGLRYGGIDVTRCF